MVELVVFSDLDGTLLDHDTYTWEPARDAVARLRRAGVPLVLATSKTAAEVAPLHAEMQLGDAPAIVENGAGIFRPGAPITGKVDYSRLRSALDTLPTSLRAPFRGFGDMTPSEVATATGLSATAAALACARRHSEPGLWQGDDAGRAAFVAALATHGVSARQGGRFLTLSFGRTKADAMRAVAAELGAARTMALGDAPNDAEMLQAADIGVLVRNDHAPPLMEELRAGLRRTDNPGPAGWADAVTRVLDELPL